MKIVFLGKSQTQRTWAAQYLRRRHKFFRKDMTDGVDRMVRLFYPYESYRRIMWQPKLRFYDALYRIDSGIWISYLGQRLALTPETSNIIVSDVRYLNELEQLKDWGFTIVRLTGKTPNRQQIVANLLDAAPGNLILQDFYNRDYENTVGVDYSVNLTDLSYTLNRELDQLVKNLTRK